MHIQLIRYHVGTPPHKYKNDSCAMYIGIIHDMGIPICYHILASCRLRNVLSTMDDISYWYTICRLCKCCIISSTSYTNIQYDICIYVGMPCLFAISRSVNLYSHFNHRFIIYTLSISVILKTYLNMQTCVQSISTCICIRILSKKNL